MFGLGRDVKVDIPISAIFGVTYSDTYMNSLTNDYAPVGWHNCNLKLDVYGTE